MTDRILIIGAGIAGISAGRALQQNGKDILILDKGRRIGGRVSTRRADGFVFDHGAQFFTAHQQPLADLCVDGIAAGKLKSWKRPNGKDAFIGAEMMRDLPDWLATMPDGTQLPIQQASEVAHIDETKEGIALRDADGKILATGAQLIMTAPAPQTQKLLQDTAPELSQTAASATFHPCWTVMLGLAEATSTSLESGRTSLPQIEAPDEDLSFAVDGRTRRHGMDTAPSLILQASANWSQAHLEDTPEEVISALRALYEAHLSQHAQNLGQPDLLPDILPEILPEILYASAHRWRYAKLAKAADAALPRTSSSGRIHLAGDWLTAPRIESAFMSGLAAATAILQ